MEYKLVEIDEYKVIIKDEEPNNYSDYITYHILGYGETEVEAYKMAFENILKPFSRSIEKIEYIGKFISYNEDFECSEDINYEYKKVEKLSCEDWVANAVSSDIKKEEFRFLQR